MRNLGSFGTPCAKGRHCIFLYLDDELLEPRLSEFRAHLAGCAACRNALADRRRFVRELRSARAPATPSPTLRARVERILRMATVVALLTGAAWIRNLLR
jgi:anti-sigma factor RsiW